MAKYGFLDVLETVLDKYMVSDYQLHWDKKNHAVEIAFIIEAQNLAGIKTVDVDGTETTEDIVLEEYVLLYHPDKSQLDREDYLVALPFDPKKGLSEEFLVYFAQYLNEVALNGLNDLMDFLADPEAEEFAIDWDPEAFENGRAGLVEEKFHPYPRY